MFGSLGKLAAGRPWFVLAFWVVVAVSAAPFADKVGGRLSAQSEVPAGSESGRVSDLVSKEFPGQDPEQLVLAVKASSGGPRVGDKNFEDAVDGAVRRVRDVEQVGEITTHREEGAERLAEEGGREEAVLIGLKTKSSAEAQSLAGEIRKKLAGMEKPSSGVEFYLTGNPAVYLDATELADRDVVRAESTALPITLAMLVVAFGALVAAFVPLVVGVSAIAVALGALFAVTQAMTVSVFAQSVITLLGLAVGIDYSLLMVNRFREELASGLPARQAAAATAATAGRTVAFSGGTVAVSLAALLIPPIDIIRSIGIAGLLVVLISVAVATTAVPAMLALLGERVNAPRLLFRLTGWTRGEGPWRRLAAAVMRRPALYAFGVVALLLALALPLKDAAVYNPGELGLSKEAESRQGVEVLKDLGLGGTLDTVDVVVDLGKGDSFYGSPAVSGVNRLTGRLEELPGVETVQSPTATGTWKMPLPLLERLYASEAAARSGSLEELAGSTIGGDGRYVLVQVVPDERLKYEEVRPFARRIEDEARSALPGDARMLVGGSPVENLDYVGSIYGSFPLAVAAVFAATFALLLAAFRSVFVAVLSVLTNALSVGAALGLLVLVFQEGYGGALLGLPEGGLGTLEDIVPITVFALTFGLSMDYQVFLLSRVQEERLAGRSVEGSITGALATTGRVISFAALIMLVVFAAFLLSGLSSIQSLGFGLAAVVLLDATLVRLVLAPAILRLIGEAGWWLPGWLGRALPKVRFEGEPAPGTEPRDRSPEPSRTA